MERKVAAILAADIYTAARSLVEFLESLISNGSVHVFCGGRSDFPPVCSCQW